ncbi:MAG TPA: transcription antitermination factor NusB [Pyrinomonadaceae bacterium]|nr:transcription antitermination factor NusB [Pyrinomonadaceae bacterium]
MGLRRKARECALQMLFAADVAGGERADELVRSYWEQLGDPEMDEAAREFATRLATGALAHTAELDERIRSRAEHWRIPRMAVVDRNVLRLAVYEFLFEPTPRTVAINEALEIARRFSTYEATQFINGILDAIKRDLDRERPQEATDGAAPENAPDREEAAPDGATAQATQGDADDDAPRHEDPDPDPPAPADDEQKASA